MIPAPDSYPFLVNQVKVTYQSEEGSEGAAYSNAVNTPVFGPIITLQKDTDRRRIALGDTIVFFVKAKNEGNTAATIQIIDLLPEGLSFIANSVLRNGMPLPGAFPPSGITLGTVQPQEEVQVSFQAILTSIPSSNRLVNQAVGEVKFLTQDSREVEWRVLSNPVQVEVQSYLLSLYLKSSTPVTFIGDVVTYTLTLTNEGNTGLEQLVATIPVPQGSIFIPGSVVASGIYDPEADPETGISLPSLRVGESAELSFQVRITAVPLSLLFVTGATVQYFAGTQLRQVKRSNEVSIRIIQPKITLSKTVNLLKAAPGDELRYQLHISNKNEIAVQAVLIDVLPQGTLFVWDSVTLDGAKLPGTRPDEGISLGTLIAGSSQVLEFKAAVTESYAATPSFSSKIENKASIQYSFFLPDGRQVKQASSSNPAVTLLFSPLLELQIICPPKRLEPGDTIHISLLLTNRGNLPADVTLTGLEPFGTIFDRESLQVNGESTGINEAMELSLGTLSPDAEQHISFRTYLDPDYSGRYLKYTLEALYAFYLDGRRYTGQVYSNSCILEVDEISE